MRIHITSLFASLVILSPLATTQAFQVNDFTFVLQINEQSLSDLENAQPFTARVPEELQGKVKFVALEFTGESRQRFNFYGPPLLIHEVPVENGVVVIPFSQETYHQLHQQNRVRFRLPDSNVSTIRIERPSGDSEWVSVEEADKTRFVRIKSGTLLEGTIETLSPLLLKSAYGPLEIDRDEIAFIKFVEPEAEGDDTAQKVVIAMKNGDFLSGTIDESKIEMSTEWGKAIIEIGNIESIADSRSVQLVRSGNNWALSQQHRVNTQPIFQQAQFQPPVFPSSANTAQPPNPLPTPKRSR